MIAPEAPYPARGGGALRTASLIEYLAPRYHLDLIVFREPGAPDPARSIPPGLTREVHVIGLPHHGRSLGARAARNAGRLLRRAPPLIDRFAGFGSQVERHLGPRRYRLGFIEHFWCAAYLEQLAARCDRTVLDLHNIESVLHQRCARAERGPAALAHRVFARAAAALEREWLPRFSLLLTPSERDAEAVRLLAPGTRTAVYPNALPARPEPHRAGEHALVFSANFGYHPNIAAVRFFARRIWPALRGRWPHLRWRLVGRNAECVRRYTQGDPRIEATGAVEDAVTEIARAQIAVVPLLAGSGTRLKILEAWAAGVPVVSTTIGAEGLGGGAMLVADRPEAFVEAVNSLLLSPDLRRELGSAGRARFESDFTWQAAWRTLETLYW